MIEGIDSITYSTDGTQKNWDDTRRFFADWGLKLLNDEADQQRWETLNGAQVVVRQPDYEYLPPAIEAGPTLREVVWGVKDEASLKSILKVLQTPGNAASSSYQTMTILEEKHVRRIACIDPHGLRTVFQISTKRPAKVQGVATNPYGNAQRIDTPSPVYERATPVDIGHVVLFTDVLAQAEAFYQALGFVTSDRYPGRGVFMRCSAQGGHHDLFLLQIHVFYRGRQVECCQNIALKKDWR